MGCNCGKNTPPAGSQPPEQQAATAPVSEAARAKAGVSVPATPVQQQSFAFTGRNGKTQTFGSKLEADAERVRSGGGSVRPVR